MTDTVREWFKAAPLPMLILGSYVYIYSVDRNVAEAVRDAAVAVASKIEQSDRLKRIEDKMDRLTDAVAVLNLATTVRLNKLEARLDKLEAEKEKK